MLKREYDKQQKTALNIIWNAAGKYDISPPFMAFNSSGDADFYFNIIIGLSIKWLNIDKLNRLFLSYQNSKKCDSFDRIAWLYLENFLYNKEVAYRPILKKLRLEHAEEFINKKGYLSRHEMMLNDIRVYEQEEYRWASLIYKNDYENDYCNGNCNGYSNSNDNGYRNHYHIENNDKKSCKNLSKSSLRLAALLESYDDNMTTEDVINHIKNILVDEFHFSDFRIDIEQANYVSGSLKHILSKMLNHENRHIDSLLTRNDIAVNNSSYELKQGYKNKHTSHREEADEEYIETCFGPCIYSEHEMNILEHELCRDNHDYCKLWITKQSNSFEIKNHKISEAVLINKDVKEQYIKNKNYFEKSKLIIESYVKKLSSNLETIFSSYMKPLPVISKAGKLNSEKAYRLDVLSDPYVFTKNGDEVENSVIIDILLDSSASRSKYQEQIASQAYILAKSILKINIPVRLLNFHSLRGYTVVQILKDYDDKNLNGIFKYFAAGWNRDGLALLTADRISDKNADAKKILIFMTDANPEDSLKMPPENGSIFNRSYAGFEGVNDTREIVKKLEDKGIYVGAVYTGPNLYVDNVKLIYGNNYVRIQDIKNLSNGICTLIQTILRKIRN